MDKNLLEKLLLKHKSIDDIAKELKVTPYKIRYWIKKYELKAYEHANISKVYKLSNKEFEDLIKSSFSSSECLRKLKLSTKGSASRTTLKRRIKELVLDTSHFKAGGYSTFNKNSKYTLEKILIENSSYTSTSSLKIKLLKENLLTYECNICKIQEWNSKPITLQLDHINGVNNDNRIENLRLLCPNCHSQTDTYAGKNNAKKLKIEKIVIKKPRPTKIVWPSNEKLAEIVFQKPLMHLSKDLGISDRAIKKHCVKNNIQIPERGYWIRK